ncbi:hypothetical protein [Streptomyces sp. sk2.1]|nr:hypothetical protein [Streptomyces sp. sk2.1]
MTAVVDGTGSTPGAQPAMGHIPQQRDRSAPARLWRVVSRWWSGD